MVGSKHVLIILFVFLASYNLAVSSKTITFHRLRLGPKEHAPETITFDCKGEGPYVGISDGRILKWRGYHIGWTEFAITSPNRPISCNGVFDSPKEKVCGRPMGLRFDMVTCELYICDSSFGLMKVGPNGGVASLLATHAEGKRLKFANSLDIDSKKQVVYFTDSSAKYRRWEALQAINDTSDRSGRFMKYDMKTRKVTVLLRNLSIANGVALSKKKDFILVTETNTQRIVKYWLTGSKFGSYEVFPRLIGNPDNIHRNSNGDFWIAERMAKSIKVNEDGTLLETLDDKIENPSDVQEFKNRLWIGYVDKQQYILYTS